MICDDMCPGIARYHSVTTDRRTIADERGTKKQIMGTIDGVSHCGSELLMTGDTGATTRPCCVDVVLLLVMVMVVAVMRCCLCARVSLPFLFIVVCGC